MQIINSKKKYSESVNFVDKNNVLVGYDMRQDCCEHADWFLSHKEDNKDLENKINSGLEDYVFDENYFVEVEPNLDNGYSCLDKGKMVRFRLTAENKPDLFLHLYNAHNGYYGHGFESKIQDKIWKSGVL